MATPKRIKIGGAYYKGYLCTVGASPGPYSVILANAGGAALNSISMTPDTYGAGDYMTLKHYADVEGKGTVLAILGETMYNPGARTAIDLDLHSAELVGAGESIQFTYTNVAGKPLRVQVLAEYIGITKTS